MANDPLQHVAKGTPLLEAVTADVLNALKQEARKSRANGMPGPSGGWSSNQVHPSLTALIRNDTGGDLPAGSIVALSDKIGDPVNEPMAFRQRPAFAGGIPAASTDLIGVLAEPIREGEIGRVVVMGGAVCDVLINDASHKYAIPIAGDETKLESAVGGPVRIEWKESSGATRVAFVFLNSGHSHEPCTGFPALLSSIAGWTGAGNQILTHDVNGCLLWVDTEECDSIADGITVDETPVTGGADGDVLVIDSGLVSSASLSSLLIGLGGISTAGTAGA